MIRVLVVDDAAFMRLQIKMMLERNGYTVVGEATNGKEAIDQFKTLQPDIITMDITMPDMTGIEALKEIKQCDSNAKVVMISAMGQEVMVREAIISGAKSFVVKPFTETHLINAITQVVSK